MRKSTNGTPKITEVTPRVAIPGGEIAIHGTGFSHEARPRVLIGSAEAPLVVGSDKYVVARVPDGIREGGLVIDNGTSTSGKWSCDIGFQIADGVHPVANPAVDSHGNIYTTLSGTRGQKMPVSVFRVEPGYAVKPFLSDLTNATGLAIDREGFIYISSRNDGVVYQSSPDGVLSLYVEGMGVATGIAFDGAGNLFVGDRSGTIFKVSPSRQIFVFATVEPSIAAFHLAFGPDGNLYVSGPTTSSFDSVYRITPEGEVETFYRGLGRPQGLAFDADGNLYVAASIGGRRGVVRLTPDAEAELFLSGPGIVGLAFAAHGSLIAATTNALFRIDCGVQGQPLLG